MTLQDVFNKSAIDAIAAYDAALLNCKQAIDAKNAAYISKLVAVSVAEKIANPTDPAVKQAVDDFNLLCSQVEQAAGKSSQTDTKLLKTQLNELQLAVKSLTKSMQYKGNRR